MGQETLRLIEARYPGHTNLKLLASGRSAGREMVVNGKTFTVGETTEESFAGVDIAFISASTAASHRFGPAAAAAGAMVIDDSSAFRMDPTAPLVVPEVNGSDLEWHNGIVSIPNCFHYAAGDGGASAAAGQRHWSGLWRIPTSRFPGRAGRR